MSPKTVSEEHLIYKKSKGEQIIVEGIVDVLEVQNMIDMVSRWKWVHKQEELPEVEMSDEEIIGLPERTGIFSFLYDNAEDIYDESDGEPLE